MLDNRLAPILASLPQLESPRPNRPRIAIKSCGRILFTDPAEVVTVEAQGNYVLLHRISGSALVLRESLSTVAEKLLPYGFVRIHRSALVNASFIEEIQSWATGDYVLRIKGGKEFNVSRTFKKNLHSIAPLWLGTDGFCSD
jgi:two-component system LytT family response regulator